MCYFLNLDLQLPMVQSSDKKIRYSGILLFILEVFVLSAYIYWTVKLFGIRLSENNEILSDIGKHYKSKYQIFSIILYGI